MNAIKAGICTLLLMWVASARCEAQLSAEALAALKAKWKPQSVKELPLTNLNAPNGYIVLKKPDVNAKEVRRELKPSVIRIRFQMDRGNQRYYLTKGSWIRAATDVKYNWVILIPAPAAPAKAETTPLDQLYKDMRHDEVQWNCANAYGEFGKICNQPKVVDFLVAKLAIEKDLQAKSCVLALLCKSSPYKHDTAFARTVLAMLVEYQAKRKTRLREIGQGGDPEGHWLFVSSTGAALNQVWIRFLVRNAPKYEDLLVPVMLDPKADFYLRWVCLHALARHKLLEKYIPKLDPPFYRMLFENLRNDDKRWNAEFATRILVILKPVSSPYIVQRLNEPRLDDQEREILNLINKDILNKSNRAKFEKEYGDLDSSIFHGIDDPNNKFDCELAIFRK